MKIIKKLNLVLLLLLSVSIQAQMRYTVRDVPNVQLEDYTRYVSDPENVLDIGDIILLDERLAEFRDSLDIEAAIVVIPAIDVEKYGSAKDFATELFNTWGIGKKETNNGLLILLLTADGEREIVFETGLGTEQVLTDGLCKLIQTKKMVPYLKTSDYGEGLIVGLEEIEKVLNGSSEFLKSDSSSSGIGKYVLIWLIVGFIVIGVVESARKKRVVESEDPFVAAANYKSLSGIGCVIATLFFGSYIIYMIYKAIAKKDDMPPLNCQNCGAKGKVVLKNKPQVVQKALPDQDGMKQYHYICKACNHGHKVLVPYKYVAPQTRSSGGGGYSSYSGSSSSSSRGGSWGGGRSGGGGASTKF
ncbi:MAG: TPM domain-containing protein [Bacteroidales bacterium]